MKKLILIPLLFLCLILSANTYYVATTGSNGNTGTIGSPWATFQYAVDQVSPGDTVYFRGGTYYPTDKIVITSTNGTGSTGNWTCYFGYPGETVIFDFSNYDEDGGYAHAILLWTGATFIHFKDFTIRHVEQIDNYVEVTAIQTVGASNITFENLTIHDLGGRGILHETPWGYPNEPAYDTTRFINVDVYDCADSLQYTEGATLGNQADGLKCYGNTTSVIYYDGCRVWNCSDDGWDGGGGQIVHINNCWSFLNGHNLSGDGDGFKLGGVDSVTAASGVISMFISNTISAFNDQAGFHLLEYEDYWRQNGRIYNSVSYGNDRSGFGVSDNALPGRENILWQVHNTIAYGNHNVALPGEDLPFSAPYMDYTESHNNWDDIGGWPGWEWTDTVTFTTADWVESDSATIVAQLKGARNADGSLPTITAFHLATGSDLIDKGTVNVNIGEALTVFNGVAPDLGAFEYGVADSSLKYILAYSFAEQTGVAVIDTAAKTVDIEVEYGTTVTALVATFTLSEGATAAVGATPQVSGTTANNFTSPVTYVVTALDASTQNWTVTVTVESEPVPTVATVATTSASYTAVTANVTGRIYSANGGTLTARGVCWSTSNTSPTTSDRHTTYSPYVGSFTDVIRGLRGNTTYYVRAYGTTSEGGTSYGDVISFTTKAYNITTSGGKIGKVNGKIGIVK